MKLAIDHQTQYRYDKPVSFGDHAMYLCPREGLNLKVTSFEMLTSPESKIRWVRDCFNNVVAVANFGLQESDNLNFTCHIECELSEENPFDFILDARATSFPFAYDQREQSALQAYLEPGIAPGSGKALDWFYHAVENPNGSDDCIGFLMDINSAVRRDIAYERRDDEGVQTPDETLDLGKGSCRDMAQLFISICRQLGLAARFVSGYLHVPPESDGSEPMENRAAGSMHAWAEIYLPGAGWKGFDPTNGVLVNHLYLTTAVANRPEWVNPIQGKYFQEERVASQMHVELNIEAVSS